MKANTLTSGVGVGGSLIAPDVRTDPTLLPRRRPSVRSLLAPGNTTSNVVFYPRQTARTNNFSVVSEGALKPQSDIQFEQKQAPVTTIASWVIASRQLFDDAPAMQSTVDGELRYMLDFAEEVELLTGDGTGVHLSGLTPNSTPFVRPFTAALEQNADVLIEAIAQAEASLLPATGLVLNPIDYMKMLALKDSQGRYLSNGPFGPAQPRLLWDLPVAPTMAMTAGHFLVGSFAVAAQVYDRMDAIVAVSSEDADNFRKNLITVLAEKRLAMAVKVPAALIYGAF